MERDQQVLDAGQEPRLLEPEERASDRHQRAGQREHDHQLQPLQRQEGRRDPAQWATGQEQPQQPELRQTPPHRHPTPRPQRKQGQGLQEPKRAPGLLRRHRPQPTGQERLAGRLRGL